MNSVGNFRILAALVLAGLASGTGHALAEAPAWQPTPVADIARCLDDKGVDVTIIDDDEIRLSKKRADEPVWRKIPGTHATARPFHPTAPAGKTAPADAEALPDCASIR